MISIKYINVSYGGRGVIRNFSADLPDSGIVAITGPSGCGKTTLLRIIAGMQKPDSGSVDRHNARVSFVFQEQRLLPWFSALENVRAVRPDGNEKEALALLDSFGISREDTTKKPYELSGGMRQRVCLARALYYGGNVYLLDEPFTGLDSENRAKALARFSAVSKQSLIVIVSHDAADAQSADKVIELENLV